MGGKRCPLWAVILVGGLIVGGVYAGREEAGKAINDGSLWDSAIGFPLDHPGSVAGCPVCGKVMTWDNKYLYECPHCGTTANVRYDVRLNRHFAQIVYHGNAPREE